jgi:hypothetical protein
MRQLRAGAEVTLRTAASERSAAATATVDIVSIALRNRQYAVIQQSSVNLRVDPLLLMAQRTHYLDVTDPKAVHVINSASNANHSVSFIAKSPPGCWTGSRKRAH